MNAKKNSFFDGFAAYLKAKNVNCNMHQGFSVHFEDSRIGFNCIWVQLNYDGNPYIYSRIGYCFSGYDDAEEFKEELGNKYPDYRFYADRYKYKYEIGLSQEFAFVSYEDAYRRVMEMEDAVIAGVEMGKERFKSGFER